MRCYCRRGDWVDNFVSFFPEKNGALCISVLETLLSTLSILTTKELTTRGHYRQLVHMKRSIRRKTLVRDPWDVCCGEVVVMTGLTVSSFLIIRRCISLRIDVLLCDGLATLAVDTVSQPGKVTVLHHIILKCTQIDNDLYTPKFHLENSGLVVVMMTFHSLNCC